MSAGIGVFYVCRTKVRGIASSGFAGCVGDSGGIGLSCLVESQEEVVEFAEDVSSAREEQRPSCFIVCYGCGTVERCFRQTFVFRGLLNWRSKCVPRLGFEHLAF